MKHHTPITDEMHQKFWELHVKHGLIPRLIASRFGVHKGTVSKYLRERRNLEGVEKPVRTDTVTIKSVASPGSAASR